MVITIEHLRQTLALTDRLKTGMNIADYLFTQFLPLYCDQLFINRAVQRMARTDPAKLTPQLANELVAQANLALWILVPIQLGYGSLPEVTDADFRIYTKNEPATDWNEFYDQFGEHHEVWGDILKDCLAKLKNPTSRIIVGRIVKMFLDRLPMPITSIG